MTRTVPRRRTILHFSHIGLTDARTFIFNLLVQPDRSESESYLTMTPELEQPHPGANEPTVSVLPSFMRQESPGEVL